MEAGFSDDDLMNESDAQELERVWLALDKIGDTPVQVFTRLRSRSRQPMPKPQHRSIPESGLYPGGHPTANTFAHASVPLQAAASGTADLPLSSTSPASTEDVNEEPETQGKSEGRNDSIATDETQSDENESPSLFSEEMEVARESLGDTRPTTPASSHSSSKDDDCDEVSEISNSGLECSDASRRAALTDVFAMITAPKSSLDRPALCKPTEIRAPALPGTRVLRSAVRRQQRSTQPLTLHSIRDDLLKRRVRKKRPTNSRLTVRSLQHEVQSHAQRQNHERREMGWAMDDIKNDIAQMRNSLLDEIDERLKTQEADFQATFEIKDLEITALRDDVLRLQDENKEMRDRLFALDA